MQKSNAQLSTFLKKNTLFIGNGYTFGVLYDIGSYPGAIFNKKSSSVIFGEIYKINSGKDKILAVLDDYEECSSNYCKPYEYLRLRVNIFVKSTSQILQCFAYQYNWPIDNKQIIQSGNYIQYRQNANK